VLKKQHVLLGALFLGISIKPMERKEVAFLSASTFLLGAGIMKGVGYVNNACEMQKRLYNDEGPYENRPIIYTGFTKITEKEDIEAGTSSTSFYIDDTDYRVRVFNKIKSNLPFFGIVGLSEESGSCLISKINEEVRKKHAPSLFDILFKGRRWYDPLDDKQIKTIIEKYKKLSLQTRANFNREFVCGWLTRNEYHKNIKEFRVVRCLNGNSGDGLAKHRLFGAWIGNVYNNSCKPLFDGESDKIQIVFKRIFDKYSFLVLALCELDDDIKSNDYGQNIVSNVREIIKKLDIQKIRKNCNGCFNGIPIKQVTRGGKGGNNIIGESAVTVVMFNNDDD